MSAITPPFRRTPLYDQHRARGGQMISFAGFHMPAFYRSPAGGALKEHHHVRRHCGVFDVSHMAQFTITGPHAHHHLDTLIPSDISTLQPGQCRYTCLLNHAGGIIDDVVVYRLTDAEYMLCVNAASQAVVSGWLNTHIPTERAEVKDVSAQYSLLAIQGPAALRTLQHLLSAEAYATAAALQYFHCATITLLDQPCLLSRTGYSGELGYELYLPAAPAVSTAAFDQLLAAPQVLPIGLSARQSLRLEAGLLLYGADMTPTTTPYQVGLGWLVHTTKATFIGREALLEPAKTSPQLYGFIMQEQGIPRPGMQIQAGDNHTPIGEVTSGAYLPTLEQAGGLALLSEPIDIGAQVVIHMRSRARTGTITKLPFYPSRARNQPHQLSSSASN